MSLFDSWTNKRQLKSKEQLDGIDGRVKSRRVLAYIVRFVTIGSGLCLASAWFLENIDTWWFLSLVFASGGILSFVLWCKSRDLTGRRPPLARNYLWPLVLPLGLLVNQSSPENGLQDPSRMFILWVTLTAYVISTLAIAWNVRKFVNKVRQYGLPLTRRYCRAALRTARIFQWVLPIFVLCVMTADMLLELSDDVAQALIGSLRNQLYGVIGAASVVLAFTAVPAEREAAVKELLLESRLDNLSREVFRLKLEVRKASLQKRFYRGGWHKFHVINANLLNELLSITQAVSLRTGPKKKGK
ncbi:hypothetical protein [Arthrobacter sp. Helios]|uniref:hypothetical protein n=1 Tax=Arthrobacter sp. Helios TaxID=2828862 RepID=UPI002055E112|nr:hypothetical protein [Arthrobacter sp. Helios]UPO76408.1 hypothetical protein ArtHe_13795 [Arthrobacter sp. Helios]